MDIQVTRPCICWGDCIGGVPLNFQECNFTWLPSQLLEDPRVILIPDHQKRKISTVIKKHQPRYNYTWTLKKRLQTAFQQGLATYRWLFRLFQLRKIFRKSREFEFFFPPQRFRKGEIPNKKIMPYLGFATLRCLEKVPKTYSPKWWWKMVLSYGTTKTNIIKTKPMM